MNNTFMIKDGAKDFEFCQNISDILKHNWNKALTRHKILKMRHKGYTFAYFLNNLKFF